MTLLAPDPARPGSFHDLGDRGDHPAVITSTSTVSYAHLDERVTELAAALGPERRLVAIEAASTVEALVAYLASLRGDHPVLLLPGGPALAGHALITGYDPDVVIGEATGWAPRPERTGTAHALHEDLALLLPTSGSTGSPKLVRLSRDNLDANAHAIVQYLGIGPGDRAITTLPMQYCYGLSVVNSHLRAGASLVLTEHSVVDRCFWDLFGHAGATSLAGVPHTFQLLDRVGFDTMSLPTLRRVTQAGGRMSPETVRRYSELGERRGWDLFVMYGQTEATARMAYLPPALARAHPHTIGVPIPGGSFTIDEPDADGVGELVYRGPNVMLGYAETPGDLALGATVDELRTGDLARRTPEGLYEITGRRSRFIKPYGLRVDLDRVERLVAEHGITAMCTGDDDRLVVAVDVEHADHVPVVERLLAEHLALPFSRVLVRCLDQLPRLHNGKPDHAALRQLATAIAAPAPPRVASSDPVDPHAAIRSAYTRILGVDAADDDTFVSLGGDSLSYVEMSILLEELLGTLPRDWHLIRLVDIAPIRRPRRILAPTDTSVILRATAITLVVGTHAHLWELPGGAHTLFAIAGYNFARFQLRAESMFAGIARIAVPSMCWIAIVAAISDKYGWPNALLINGLVERPGDRWGYWFIEALVQTLIVLALLRAVPAVGRLERSRPLALPLLAVAAGLVFRFDVVEFTMSHRNLRPHEAFWLFALGWTAARATNWSHRLLVSALAAVAVPGFYNHDTSRELIILTGILLITWVPTVPVPRVARRVIAPVAGASLYIYLTHLQVYPPLGRLYGPAAAVAGSLLVGVGAWIVARRLTDRAEHAIRRCRCRSRATRPARGSSPGCRRWPSRPRERATAT